MDFVDYEFDSKEQFWEELDDMLLSDAHSPSLIANSVRSFVRFATKFMEEYLASDEDLMRCCVKFLNCPLFVKHRGQVRRILITTLVQPETPLRTLLLSGIVLLLDGRKHNDTFEMMQEEEVCPVVIDIVWHCRAVDHRLHECYLEILYEMCRVQRLRFCDLDHITDDLIEYLFNCVEHNDSYDSDPYGYSHIRILLVLNEQYMLLQNARSSLNSHSEPVENKVLTVLALKGHIYKIFGTNIIILLNREQDTALQLLILKMLYQLFTHKATQEYFYTNDLTVLVDVFIRELHDLAEDADALRHTFLRVLHPMLAYTQLRQIQYKRDELVKLLKMLGGSNRSGHYLPISETTQRLVARCMTVPWLEAFFSFDDEHPIHRLTLQHRLYSFGKSSSDHGSAGNSAGNSIGIHYDGQKQGDVSSISSTVSISSQIALPNAFPALDSMTVPHSPTKSESTVNVTPSADATGGGNYGSGLITGEA
ncbi:uncharacterized protein V1516DRAFT_671392 [Lipomyces oligophaga]|uniref:uncharacterized protein n=1 Tax=Lipomyces oligophaga TaxID=45792 RepID=UPI0034CE4DF3